MVIQSKGFGISDNEDAKTLVYDNGAGQSVTDSLRVAMKFKKNHRDVLRDIRELLRTAQNCAVLEKRESILSMFVEITYLNEQNKEQPMFIMTESGFSLLAMGFTGQKAFEFKTDFLFAFQRQAELLNNVINNQLRAAKESAKQRLLKSGRIREIDVIVKDMMRERRVLVKELNKIDRSDFLQLGFSFALEEN